MFHRLNTLLSNFKFKRTWVASFTLAIAVTLLLGGYAIAQYPGFSDPGAKAGSTGGGAGLVAVEPSIDGGEIPAGATAQVVVRFRNDGSQPVQTGLIRLYPSSTVSAVISLNQCEEEPLPGGAECAIALSVKGLQTGPWRVEMLMSHSGRTRLVTATTSGSVEVIGDADQNLATDVEAIPNELEFGSLSSSQTLVQPVVLRNITSKPIDVADIYVDASEQAGYSLETECNTLEPGQACIAIVSWSPQISGRSSGVIVVRHTGPTALTSVSLSGEYEPENVTEAELFPQAVPGKGLLVSSQTEVDFGTSIDTNSTMTVSLVNAGDSDITLSDIQLSGSDNGLSFKKTGCAVGMILEPIEACALTVAWSPSRIGAIFDDMQISHTGARGILVLPIRGSASAAVSKDQKAIVLSKPVTTVVADPAPRNSDPVAANRAAEQKQQRKFTLKQEESYGEQDVTSTLDGYRITSFGKNKAIINGPGGSRIVFDQQEAVIGGVPFVVVIQNNGIEFLHKAQRILLLFDRSLSSANTNGSSNRTATAQISSNNEN